MSAQAWSSRSGAILSKSGTRRGKFSRAFDERGEERFEFGFVLQAAQARRVGRGDVDRHVGGEGAEFA